MSFLHTLRWRVCKQHLRDIYSSAILQHLFSTTLQYLLFRSEKNQQTRKIEIFQTWNFSKYKTLWTFSKFGSLDMISRNILGIIDKCRKSSKYQEISDLTFCFKDTAYRVCVRWERTKFRMDPASVSQSETFAHIGITYVVMSECNVSRDAFKRYDFGTKYSEEHNSS